MKTKSTLWDLPLIKLQTIHFWTDDDATLFLPHVFILFHCFFFCLFHTEQMNAMGNAFVACGVIYCIDGYHANPTTINFAYDTKTGQQWNPNIQFTNQYGYNSMVDYNPRERVLYAWDQKHQITYSLVWNWIGEQDRRKWQMIMLITRGRGGGLFCSGVAFMSYGMKKGERNNGHLRIKGFKISRTSPW